jgi:integrase
MRIILTLATSLGLRLAECISACPAGYSAEKHTLTFIAKGPKTVTLPTTPNVDTLLQALPIPENPMTPFVETARNRRMTVSAAHHQWASLKEKARVNRELILHDLRRSAAVALYDLSKDLRMVEQLLGHQSLSTTGRYLEHRDPDKLRPLLAEMWRPKGSKETVQ